MELSREDIATIFPEPEMFVLGMRLYKLVQSCRGDMSTQELLADLPDDDHSYSTNSSGRKRSLSSDTCSSSHRKIRKVSSGVEFKLPRFSVDIERCIKKDTFYTSPQRNKLIREACNALSGHCRLHGRPVTTDDKKDLAVRLY